MFRRELRKPDGRALTLYARAPLPAGLEAPSPAGGGAGASHLRWHPLRGEWIVYAGHRQTRTFLPPAEFNPLAPSRDAAAPTEVPAGPWDVAVFDNMFPAMRAGNAESPPRPIPLVETRPGRGACEVVVFTQDPKASLATLPVEHVALVLEVLGERTAALGAREDVAYVMPFENRGVEVGVTLHHPHGQIYAYPFVPPIPARELEQQRAYHQRTGRGLLAELVAAEESDGRRIVLAGPHAVSFIPAFARYAYELWLAPREPVPSLDLLSAPQRDDLAAVLRASLRKLDGLWSEPAPYVMVFHQAPADGEPHPESHVHIEIYPAYRMKRRLKYLAGSELGAGVFTADTFPEEKAAELRAVEVGP